MNIDKVNFAISSGTSHINFITLFYLISTMQLQSCVCPLTVDKTVICVLHCRILQSLTS